VGQKCFEAECGKHEGKYTAYVYCHVTIIGDEGDG